MMLEMSPDNVVQAKLAEYDLCTADANHLEVQIWTTAGILVTGSVAGIGFLGGTVPDPPTLYDLLFRCGVGILFITLLWLWRRIVARWYSIQRILYTRLTEIEEELGLYKERYIHWITDYLKNQTVPTDPKGCQLVGQLQPTQSLASVRQTVDRLGRVLILVWALFVALQLVAMAYGLSKRSDVASAKCCLSKNSDRKTESPVGR